MRQPALKKKGPGERDHIRVLAGDKTVSDMLVFLMYRKLKILLQVDEVRVPANKGEINTDC